MKCNGASRQPSEEAIVKAIKFIAECIVIGATFALLVFLAAASP